MGSMDDTMTGTPLIFYVAHQIKGIIEVAFDPEKESGSSLSIVNINTNAGKQPQWLIPNGNKIYGISRTAYPDDTAKDGGVFVFNKPDQSSTGTPFKLISSRTSHGQGGVHVDVSPNGRMLCAVNIEACSMAVFPLSEDGTVAEAVFTTDFILDNPGPAVRGLQARSFPHQAYFDPTNQYLLIPCRGEDKVRIYSMANFPDVVETTALSFPPGTGPRHVHFHNTAEGTLLYVLGELANTVSVLTVKYPSDPTGDLTFTHHQQISTLGADLPPSPPDRGHMAADLAISNDNRYLYVANRRPLGEHANPDPTDSIAVFSLNHSKSSLDNGTHLSLVKLEDTLGNIPRHFALSPDPKNAYVVVCNEFSNDLVVFDRDEESGTFGKIRGRLQFDDMGGKGVWKSRMGPACVLWK
jgi:6-phosphogluconolactonase